MTEPIPLTPRQITSLAYRKANKERIADSQRIWITNNKERRAESKRVWRMANPERVQNGGNKRRGNIVGEITPGWIPKLLELQRWTCIVCNKDLRLGYHIDHIEPIVRGGENSDYNLQALCPKCNLEKSDKDPIDFMQSRGFLL